MAIEKEETVVTKQVQVLVNEPTLEDERFEELLQTGESPTGTFKASPPRRLPSSPLTTSSKCQKLDRSLYLSITMPSITNRFCFHARLLPHLSQLLSAICLGFLVRLSSLFIVIMRRLLRGCGAGSLELERTRTLCLRETLTPM